MVDVFSAICRTLPTDASLTFHSYEMTLVAFGWLFARCVIALIRERPNEYDIGSILNYLEMRGTRGQRAA